MKHIEVAIGIVYQGNSVLICQRHHDAAQGGLWEFPGGKIELDETPEQCAIREVAEEVGLAVKSTASFPIIDHRYADVEVRIHPFLCVVRGGQARPLASQRLLWVPVNRLPDYPSPPANKHLIGQIIACLTQDNQAIDFPPTDS